MTTVEHLLGKSRHIWQQYYVHPFVLGIQEGTLEQEKFRQYMIQDYLYLVDYTKTFAIGVAKANSIPTMQLFAGSIHTLTHTEMDIHRGYMGTLAITQEEIDTTKPALPNLSYTSYMLRQAYEGSVVEVLASILSCAYSYEVIAKTMVQNRPECVDDALYGSWIRGYASDDYAEKNQVLIEMLNDWTKEYTEAQQQRLEDIFLACSEYELAFWDMAWMMK
ncbi:thiaminase II [Bengtsoniella intestinalis]|uniref:thiaminase II n=1 Tax=Bengtsoniella intestinalis TaxID=3073143 RepID=UPI00391EFC6B